VPAVPSCILEPLWDQFQALLPARRVSHPLGCHRPRVPDRVILDKLIQVLVFGCGYRRIADQGCSATTLRRRRDEWIALRSAEHLHQLALHAYDRLLGLELDTWPLTAASGLTVAWERLGVVDTCSGPRAGGPQPGCPSDAAVVSET
jgi:transposase